MRKLQALTCSFVFSNKHDRKSGIHMKQVLLSIMVVLLFSTTVFTQSTSKLRTGWYRASIFREDGAAIIFNAEVQLKNGKHIMYIRNAAERLLVDDIKLKGDSVNIEMPFFESFFRLQIQQDGKLVGKWFKAGSLKLLELVLPVWLRVE